MINNCEKCGNYADDGLRIDEKGFNVCINRCSIKNQTSDCCNANPIGEIFDGFGRCFDCKDMAHFSDEVGN